MDQHLQVFITVVERKNFSRAAEELLMTQPAVSQYIRTFEENMGAKLLERTSKYVRLTKTGEIVYHHAKEIVGLYTRMQTLVDDLHHHASGPLSIGASFTFGEYILPHIIAKMQVDTPNIEPTVTIGNTKEITNYMKHHQLDVGIIEGSFTVSEGMYVEDFAEDHMVVVASPSHPLARKKAPVIIHELVDERWILREDGSGTREATEKIFTKHKMAPASIMNFGSTQAIKEAVEAGLGISILSKWAIRREIENRQLQIVDVVGYPYTRKFSIVTASPYMTKAQQVFIHLLHNSKEITALPFDQL